MIKTDGKNISKLFFPFLPGFIILSFLFIVSRYNYLIFHTLAEFFSIIIAWGIFIIVWNTKETVKNDPLVFIGIAYLFIGGLDLFHTLSYKGMGVLGPEQGANPATQLWIIARYMESITLCMFSFLLGKRIKVAIPIGVYSIVSAITLFLVFIWDLFPACYVEGVGLTIFKKNSEYIICILLMAAFFFLYKKKNLLDQTVYKLLAVSIVLTIMAELAFTFYVSVYGFSNLIGHFLKIISFYLIYKAFIHTGLKEPYRLMFKEISDKEKRYRQIFETNQAVKLIINPADGSIVEANDAACHFYGYTKNTFLSLKVSDISALPPNKATEEMNKVTSEKELFFNFPHRLASGEVRDVEVYSGPIKYGQDTFLYSIIHDVTKRKQAEEALKASEKKYQSLFNDAQVALFRNRLSDGKILEINERYAKMAGYSNIQDCMAEFNAADAWVDPNERKKLMEILQENGFISDYETEIIRKDGAKIWISFSAMIFPEKEFLEGSIVDITERKQKEDRYKKTIESSIDGFWIIDIKGKFLEVNDAYSTMIGYNRDELLKMSIMDVEALEHPEETKKRIEKIIKNGSVRFESTHRHKKGHIINVEVSSTYTQDSGGLCFVFLRDITDRNRIEERLRENEEKYRTLFERESNAIFIYDPDTTNILDANAATSKLYGYSHEELIGMSCMKFSAEAKQSKSAMEKIRENGEVSVPNRLHRKKDGTVFPVDISGYSVTISGEEVMYAVSKDITKQKKTEKALKNNQNFLNRIIDQSPFAIWVSDKKGTIIKCNLALTKLLNITDEQLIGKYNVFEDGIAIKQGLIPKIRTVFEDGKTANFSVEWDANELGYKDAHKVHIEGTMFPIHDDKGNLTNVVNHWIDVTKHKQAEKIKMQLESQVQQSQKMESIGTLAGGIAHDFNNILFPIVGHTEMLLQDVPEDSPFKDGLNQIYAGAMRASDLVKQILTFSRQESGELKLMKMQPIIKEVLKLIRSTIPTTIDIKQNIDLKCGVIKADPTQIHQIVMNLCTNAYHAMEEAGGELKVSLKENKLSESDLITHDIAPGDYACLSIADTGKGMDKELTDKIFDPFFTTKEKGKGTGMGLSVVHGIVKSMGGAIQIDSEYRKGTEFHVYLPVEKSFSEEQVIDSKVEIQSGTEQVLLVDDEETILSMEKQMLKRLGYQVTSRTSSIEALEAFRAAPDKFDLVITDMAMPNMPGNKLSAELIKIRSDIPVLLCTGFSETMSKEKAASIGIKGFLLKPIMMKDLAQKIREVLDSNKTENTN